MSSESYPCYVRICDAGSETVELPTEEDGTILLSTIKAQFPKAIGLRFKSATGSWRGINVKNDALHPPQDGWGYAEFSVTTGGTKRKADQDVMPSVKKPLSESDLIVLGLPYSTTEEEMRKYFEQFGELQTCEVKLEAETGVSKGFGFIRYSTNEAVEKVLAVPHTIEGRRCEVRFPKRDALETPTKLFVGRLPKETTVEEVKTHFSEFGVLTDVYIPSEFRGFGFITFGSVDDARKCLAATHVFKGSFLNVCHPSPKDKSKQKDKTKTDGYYSNGYSKTTKVA